MNDMVCLYRSPIPMERRGGCFTQIFSTCLAAKLSGGGGAASCGADENQHEKIEGGMLLIKEE
jgi:hypothetical protein